jgi:arginine decarboxylase
MKFTRLYMGQGVGSAKEDKNAKDIASACFGVESLNLVSVSSVLPPGIDLIGREEFLSSVSPGEAVHAIHGTCKSDVPGQVVSSTLSLAIPDDPGVPGFVCELYEHVGLVSQVAIKRTEVMLLELLARRYGVAEFDPIGAWEVAGPHEIRDATISTRYTVGPQAVTIHTLHAEGVVNWAGDYCVALAAACLLP